MTADSPKVSAHAVEREIIARLTAMKVRLRFDKVALRLSGDLKAALASAAPEGQAFLFTISAPIRLPGKTAAALEKLARSKPQEGERHKIVHGNEVRLRRLRGARKAMPRVLVFVHNAGSDAGAILAVAEARLLDPNEDA